MKKRVLSAWLVLCMLLTLLPTAAWAAEREETPLGEEAAAAPVAEKAPAAPVRAQTLDVGDPMEPDPDIVEWLQGRTLKVCGVTVTAENANNILEGTSYYNGSTPAQFGFYTRGDTVKPILILTDLNVDDSAQDPKLDHVIEYIGTGEPDDVLYVEIWNLLSQESTFVSSARNAVDISVKNGSLDLSGFNGDATNTLNLEGTMGPTNLEVRNGDLHIHDITLTADGWGEDGIYVSNGRLTVSGAGTVVTTTAGTGRGGSTPIYGLESQTQLTLDDIFILEDGLAITSPTGAKAVLTVEDPNPEYGKNYYSHTVAFTDEDGTLFDGADVVISKPHAHNGVTFDHTLASDAQTVEDSDTGTVTTTLYLLLDGEPLAGLGDSGIEIKNDLPAGSYLLTDNIDFDKGLKVNAGTVNLCLDGKTMEAGNFVMVEGGQTLTLSDCKNGQGARHDGTVVYVSGQIVDFNTTPYTYALGELVMESGKLVNTQADTASSPAGAIDSTGYVTLRGGEVSGPYVVDFTYSDRSYTKPPITLAGAPKLNGSLADIHIVHDTPSVDHLPLIDATGYTGSEAVSIAVDVYDGALSDKRGTPIVKLGDTPADKFTLTNEGYCLEKMSVNGVTCLVLAEKPPVQAKWGADAEHLSAEGTLAEALTAAGADSTVGYIQLVDDVAAADGETHTANGGTFTLDLNGHSVVGGTGGNRFENCEGNPALTVEGAKVTLTNTANAGGTLKGGQGGTYQTNASGFNCGGSGVKVRSGALTVDSDGVTLVCGDPGPDRTTAKVASSATALDIWGGETILKAGRYDASVTAEGRQTCGNAIYVGSDSATLTVPKDSTLLATADAQGQALYMAGGTANIAGGTFGDPSALPRWGARFADATCVISGGSFSGSNYGLHVWYDTAQVTLSGGTFSGGLKAVRLPTPDPEEEPMTYYAALLADGYGFSIDGSTILTQESELSKAKELSVIPPPHVHSISTDCSTTQGDQVTFTPWSDATKLPTTAGHYYLTTDVAVSDMDAVTFRCDYWIVPDGVVDLCLNGHTITRASDGTLSSDPTIYFTHTKNSTLNLCDCSEDKTGAILPGNGSKSTTIENRHGTLRLYGGTVQGELFGVSVTEGSAFEMHGGTVTGTHTYTEAGGTFGAGVYVGPSDTFRMTGGTITGNDRGMQVMNGGTFLVEGNVVIADNETANVWLEDYASDPTVVHLTGALGETAKLSLNAGDWSRVEERSSLAAVRGQDYPITQADFAKLTSYDPDYPLRLADGVVSFVIGPRHTHAVSVGCQAEGEGLVTFTRLSAKDGVLYIGTKKLEPDSEDRYQLPGGNYYLTEDIELGYPIVVPSNRFGGSVSLCLNGHQLKYTGTGERHTVISTPWELNICDCNGSQGHHTVTDPTTNESVDIVGGLITGGTNGGVIVNRIAGGENTFNLYGGAIAGNQGSWGGGVTLSDNTKMVLYGGQVSYNTWRLDSRYTGFGGICAINATENVSASVEITGEGKVAHNLGGGVRIENHGTVTLSGSAAVADNQGIGNWPSGICLDKNSTLTMSGSASVTGNHITTDFYLSAPTCGGVYAPGGGVTLSGGAKIWNNKIDQPGGMTAAADLVLGSEFDTQGGDALVTIGGPLTADAKIGVSLLTPGQKVFTTGGGGDYADRFTSQQRGRFVGAREGELSLTPYAILQQPTQANQCTVTVNGAPTSYKWYPAKLAEVTGANATAYTTEQGESSSCDGQGVWTGVKDLYDRYFFTIQLSRGDMLVVKPSQDLGYMPSVQIVSQDQDHVATGSNTPGQDGAYRVTVPRDGTYDLSLSSQVEDLTLTATWLALGAEVEGQTTKQFTGEPGSYLCKIRYTDGTTLTTDIVTCDGSSPTPTPSANPSAEPSAKPSAEPSAKPSAEPSAKPSAEPSAKPTSTPTPGKTDQAAPAGLFTVTDIPVGGTSGSIAVTKDADKLEWRPVTTPATGVWTPVAQSGDTATLTGLAAGSYEFRYKETATHNASPATQVQVRALSPDAKTLTIAGGIEHGTVTKRRDMVNPGDTVTLAVQPDAGYQLETITVRYTEGGVEKTITPTVKADNPAQYTFTMPDAAVSVTATFIPIPDQGNAKGEVDIKPDTPAVSVDKETLKDLAGEVPEGQSVTVKLTVEKQEAPAGKAELEGIIQGSKDDVLYLDLSLFKQVNDQEPQAITDTGSKVLEIKVPYDFTGKRNVTVYRKHGDSAAEKLTKLTARPTQGFADGTFFADSKNGAVYIYASKFSTYAIGYAPETSTSTSSRRPSRSPAETQEVWPFTDVTADDWFYGSVKYVYGQGAMEGTSSAAFSPALDTSRASIATILWRLAGSPAAKGALPYPDCKADTWYAQAVIWATGAGVVKGYGSGDFGPDDTITREQLVLMLWRYAGSPETSGELSAFADQSAVSGWVYPAMEWAVERGVITGKPGGILDPQGQVTRAETAAMLERYLQAEQ